MSREWRTAASVSLAWVRNGRRPWTARCALTRHATATAAVSSVAGEGTVAAPGHGNAPGARACTAAGAGARAVARRSATVTQTAAVPRAITAHGRRRRRHAGEAGRAYGERTPSNVEGRPHRRFGVGLRRETLAKRRPARSRGRTQPVSRSAIRGGPSAERALGVRIRIAGPRRRRGAARRRGPVPPERMAARLGRRDGQR